MKKIILTIAACAALVACKKDDNGQLDPNAMIALNYAATAPTSAATTYSYNPDGSAKYLSAREIVEKASTLEGLGGSGRGFNDQQRDLVNNRLLMWSTDVITSKGTLMEEWITDRDLILVLRTSRDAGKVIDTIAYIPNAVMIKAERDIRTAFADGNLRECYRLFDKAFTFIPITGNEWKALKAKGQN